MRYIETAKATDAVLAAITGNPDSPIAAAAQTLLYIPATNFKLSHHSSEKSVLVMGSLFEHSLGLICDLLIIRLNGSLDVAQSAMNARHANLE